LQGVILWKTIVSAKQSSERQLRAYIHVETVVIYGLKSGAAPKIVIRIKNFWQTPARNIVNNYGFEVFKSPMAENFRLAGMKRGEMPDIAPNQAGHSIISIDRTA
jgi:hypothetical protein